MKILSYSLLSCGWVLGVPLGCHLGQTKTHSVHSKAQLIDPNELKELVISRDEWHREHAPTHLDHVDNVVRQPENAEHHHDGQDELLAAYCPAELGLPQAPQDEEVADYDDRVRKDEARHRLEGVLKPHLRSGGHKAVSLV